LLEYWYIKSALVGDNGIDESGAIYIAGKLEMNKGIRTLYLSKSGLIV